MYLLAAGMWLKWTAVPRLALGGVQRDVTHAELVGPAREGNVKHVNVATARVLDGGHSTTHANDVHGVGDGGQSAGNIGHTGNEDVADGTRVDSRDGGVPGSSVVGHTVTHSPVGGNRHQTTSAHPSRAALVAKVAIETHSIGQWPP
jgi:hypothetical protein